MITLCRDCKHQKCSCPRTEYTLFLTREQRDCITFALGTFKNANNEEIRIADEALQRSLAERIRRQNTRWNAVINRVSEQLRKRRVAPQVKDPRKKS